jgi:hypothetical protein
MAGMTDGDDSDPDADHRVVGEHIRDQTNRQGNDSSDV